jgi:predicted RNase H-like nuclease (RuvC/YqgF family)
MNYEGIAALIVALTGVYIALRASKEVKAKAVKYNANAASQIAASALQMLEPYKQRVEELEEQVGLLKARVTELEAEVARLTKKADCWQDVANRLSHQVQSLNHIPVCDVETECN